MNWKVRIPDCIKNYKGEYKLEVSVIFDAYTNRLLKIEVLDKPIFSNTGFHIVEKVAFNIDTPTFNKDVEDFIKKYS